MAHQEVPGFARHLDIFGDDAPGKLQYVPPLLVHYRIVVVSGLPDIRIVAGTPVETVIAVFSLDTIIAFIALDNIVQEIPRKDVVPGRSLNHRPHGGTLGRKLFGDRIERPYRPVAKTDFVGRLLGTLEKILDGDALSSDEDSKVVLLPGQLYGTLLDPFAQNQGIFTRGIDDGIVAVAYIPYIDIVAAATAENVVATAPHQGIRRDIMPFYRLARSRTLVSRDLGQNILQGQL